MKTTNLKLTKKSRWVCLFFGFYSKITDAEQQALVRVCSKLCNRVVLGKQRLFFELDPARPHLNLGSLQFKVERFAETWELPHSVWQWGVGRSLAESWVQVRWKSLNSALLPIEALEDVAHPLHSSSMSSEVSVSKFRVLRVLGYQTVEDLKRMPPDLLVVRLQSLVELPVVLEWLEGLDPWLEQVTTQSLTEALARELDESEILDVELTEAC